MRLGQITIPAGGIMALATNQDFVRGGYNIYCSLLQIQNNAANPIRIGDNTASVTTPAAVSGGTAGKGMLVFPSGSENAVPCIFRGTLLSEWYIAGTPGDVIDFLYETSN